MSGTPSPTRPTHDLGDESWDRPAGLDVSYYRERLTEPGLADLAIPVEIAPGEFEPAVPCGPHRLAGHLVALDPGLAAHVVDHLRDQPGFPGVRTTTPEPAHGIWPVAWGQPVPDPPGCGHRLCTAAHHLHAGIAYGYRPHAIRAFLGTQLLTEP